MKFEMFGFIFHRKRLPIQHLSVNEQRRITDLYNRYSISLERIRAMKRIKKIAKKMFYNKIVPAYINNPDMRNRIFGIRVGTINLPLSDVKHLEQWEITRIIAREIYALACSNDMNIELHGSGTRDGNDGYYWHVEVKCQDDRGSTVERNVKEEDLKSLFEYLNK